MTELKSVFSDNSEQLMKIKINKRHTQKYLNFKVKILKIIILNAALYLKRTAHG